MEGRLDNDWRTDLVDDPPTINITGRTEFNVGWNLRVPQDPGVYIISDLRGPLYVGRTENLKRRFTDHLKNSHNRRLSKALSVPVGETTFHWIRSEYEETFKLEREIIRRLQPICNDLMYVSDE